MRATIIRDWSDFDSLEPEWNDLLFRSDASSVFLTWEWISAWRAAINDSVSPYVIVVRDVNDRLAGVAPLYFASMRLLKVLQYRALRYMADVATGLEYPDWIAEIEREDDVVAAISDCLRADSANWDTLWLPRVAGWNGARHRLLSLSAKHDFKYRIRSHVFSRIELPSTIVAYEKTLSLKRQYELRRNERRLRQLGDIAFSVCENSEDLPEFLAALFELHHQRWRVHGEQGVFKSKPTVKRFYLNFAPVAQQKGWLALFGLRHKGNLKAVQIGYVFDGVFHSLQAGFDPDFLKGVGNMLRYRVIDYLIDRGVEAIDHLGGYAEHKRRWGAMQRNGYDIFVIAPKTRTLPLAVREFWPSGRFIDQFGSSTD